MKSKIQKSLLNKKMSSLDGVIDSSLRSFVKGLKKNKWYGGETEAINVFVFSHLLKKIRKNSVFFDPAQIEIEAGVQQIYKSSPKRRRHLFTRKDLLIWDKPGANCWDEKKNPVNIPLCILEWKIRGFGRTKLKKFEVYRPDLDWIKLYSKKNKDFLGYAITLDISKGEYKLKYVKVNVGVSSKELILK